MTTRLPFASYLDHLRIESEAFAVALTDVPDDRQVPTCPDWTALDLAHHLTEVQSFWAAVVSGPLLTDEAAEDVAKPAPAASVPAQLKDLRAASARLAAALATTPADTPAWTWSTEQTVGFTFRRQAHEALVHRLDAQLTAGLRTPVDPTLATDGVDEALRVMFGGCPPWGQITPVAGPTVRLVTSDTGASWLTSPARFTGTDPDGTAYDDPDIVVAESDSGGDVAATITGTAEDLLCWLWKRPTVGTLSHMGDESALAAVNQVVTQPIN